MPDRPAPAPPDDEATPGNGTTPPGPATSGGSATSGGRAASGEPAAPGDRAAADDGAASGGSEGPRGVAAGGGEARELGAGFRLAAFGALIVVVLFAGYGIGRLNNSVESAASPSSPQSTHDMSGMSAPAAPHDDTGAAPHVHNGDGTVTQVAGSGSNAAQAVGGLAVTAGGLTLEPETATFAAGRRQPFRFRVAGAGGAPVTTYAVVHDKPLHLVVVRRDLSGFQHLHPAMAPDGTWSIDLTLAEPGSYRAVADFTAVVGGQQTPATLGADLTVPGDYRPAALPEPAAQATVDGFTVDLGGTLTTAATQPLLLTVRDAAGKAAPLEPYLGAFGHLVVFREGDVGYVHVHPEPEPVDGAVKFWLTAPGPGRYRMFFDFQVAGQVHTAAFTTILD